METSMLNATIVNVIETAWPYILTAVLLFTFCALLKTGFEIIINRKDGDKRKEAIKSIIYIAVGALVVVGSLFITKLILGTATGITEQLQTSQQDK